MAGVAEMRNEHTIFVGKSGHLGDLRIFWRTVCMSVDCIQLSQDRVQWHAFECINEFANKSRGFLDHLSNCHSSRRTQHHQVILLIFNIYVGMMAPKMPCLLSFDFGVQG